jgi:hypothetical protein
MDIGLKVTNPDCLRTPLLADAGVVAVALPQHLDRHA